MKTLLTTICVLFLFLSHPILADDHCSVSGYHDPNTQIYIGATTCTGVTINNINVHGSLTVTDATLLGNTVVTGSIVSSDTRFDEIHIHNNYSHMPIQLKNQSIVNGQLVFDNKSGTYCVDASSFILDGVVNGRIFCI